MNGKKKVVVFAVLLLATSLFFSVSFVSANWFGDMWGRITGNVVLDPQNITVYYNFKVEDSYSDPRFIIDGVDYVPSHDDVTASKWCELIADIEGKNFNKGISRLQSWQGIVSSVKWESNSWKKVSDNYVRWHDCSFLEEEPSPIVCSVNSDCGEPVNQSSKGCIDSSTGWTNSSFSIPTCMNPGTSESYCTTSSGASGGQFTCGDGNVCEGGECIDKTNLSCSDSDGGLNYYEKGEFFSYLDGAGGYDSCLDSTTLIEGYCDGGAEGGVGFVNYSCSEGCLDGACVRPNSCQDGLFYTLSRGQEINFNVNGENHTLELLQAYDGSAELILNRNRLLVLMEGDLDVRERDFLIEVTRVVHNEADVAIHTDCTSQVKDCDSMTDLMKSPTNLTIDGRNWENLYSSSSEFSSSSWAAWRYSSSNQNTFVWASLSELSDSNAAQQALNNALEHNLCDKRRVYLDFSSGEYETVYACKNLWRVAQDENRITQSNPWSYDNDVVVLWIKDNLLFNFEFSSNDYFSCNTAEQCDWMEEWNHRRQQEDLINFVEKLIDNEGTWTGSHLDYRSESFVKHFLEVCPSEVSDEGYMGSWNCKMEPVLCPPHGEQTQKCVRWNSELGQEETRETTLSCNPGICSGCYVPSWTGMRDQTPTCVEYGFRFRQQTGWNLEDVFVNESHEEGLTVADTEGYLDIDLSVYENSTALLSLVIDISGNKEEIQLMEGESYDWNQFMGDYSSNINYTLYVDEISYNAEEYSDSYISITFNAVGHETRNVPEHLNLYCDIDGRVKEQKTEAWGECQNNFECESNLCSYGECVDLKGIAEQVEGFRGFVVKMLCRLGNPFNDDGYLQCVAENTQL